MTVFLIISFIMSLLARVLLGAFADKVSFFAALLTPLTCITVFLGVIMAVFIGIEIYNKITGKKK